MEPPSASPESARPVWIVPAIAAGLALLFIVVIAIENGHGRKAAPPVTTTSTATTAPPTDAPSGNRGNPLPIGTSGELAGWRVTVLSSSRAGDEVTASVGLLWDGVDDTSGGDVKALVLQAQDLGGKLHGLGGAACAGAQVTDLGTVPVLDIGQATTLALCWTVANLGQSPVALAAKVAAGTDVTVFALA